MTTDTPNDSTEAMVPEGKYECREHTELESEKAGALTDENTGQETRSRKVRIDTGTNQGVRSVRVSVDIAAQNRKGEIADLNKRLQKLRCKE